MANRFVVWHQPLEINEIERALEIERSLDRERALEGVESSPRFNDRPGAINRSTEQAAGDVRR
jgi:hypothetical protein